MKTVTIAVAGLLAAGAAVVASQDHPSGPKPQKEHEWLQQLVGEWESEAEFAVDPSQPPQKAKGTETGRMIGGYWAVCENKGDFMGRPFTGILVLGFDAAAKRYVGSWFDSASSHLWQYEGLLDSDGRTLLLESEGPSPDFPGERTRFRETIELRSADHKVFSTARVKDGKWVTSMTINYHRRK